MYALLSAHMIRALEDKRSPVLPRDGHRGVRFNFEGDLASNGGELVRLEDLWQHWNTWDTALFEARTNSDSVEKRGTAQPGRIQLVARVERWCEDAFRRFAIQNVLETLESVERLIATEVPLDPRPRRAIEAAQQFLDGAISAPELEAARDEALDAYRSIDVAVASIFTAPRHELFRAKAQDIALAATLLATPDGPDQTSGTMMRRAVHAAFASHCRTRGAPIAAMVCGRRREAEFLAFLGLGTEKELTAIREGKVQSAVVYPVAVKGLEVVDPHDTGGG